MCSKVELNKPKDTRATINSGAWYVMTGVLHASQQRARIISYTRLEGKGCVTGNQIKQHIQSNMNLQCRMERNRYIKWIIFIYIIEQGRRQERDVVKECGWVRKRPRSSRTITRT